MVQVIFLNSLIINSSSPCFLSLRGNRNESLSKNLIKGPFTEHYNDCFSLFFKTSDFNIESNQFGLTSINSYLSDTFFVCSSMFGSGRNMYSTIFLETGALEFWIFHFSIKEDKHNVSLVWWMIASQFGWLALLRVMKYSMKHRILLASLYYTVLTW